MDPRATKHEAAPYQNSLSPQTSSFICPFDADQASLFHKLMNRVVHIRSESTKTLIETHVYLVIEAFLQATSSLCSTLGKGSILDHHATVIRGSANVSFLKKEEHALDSDVDILFKFSSPPPLNQHPEKQAADFKAFCAMLALAALKILNPEFKHKIVNTDGTLTCVPSSATALIFNRVEGVFKKFVTNSRDQLICILSFGDLDITFQFGHPKGFQTPTSSTFLPPSTPTFLHDAPETIIQTTLVGGINRAAIPLFSSTTPLEESFKALAGRVLKILNPDMFRGYIRLFHAISKGLLPSLKPLEGASEEDKIIQILSQIEPIPEAIPLSFFYGFIKEKSTSAAFRLHFFLNAYQTVILINESKESEVKAVSDFLTLLHNAFLHPDWQALFPSYVLGLLRFKNPLNLLAAAFEIKAHTDFVHENALKDSMGTHVRLVGREDKVHGFYLTKSRSFDSILKSIKFLRSELESSLFIEIFKTELDSLPFLKCEQDRKFLFLYGLRILAQEQLYQEEFESFLPIMNEFLALWTLHEEVIAASFAEYDLYTKYSLFVGRYKANLFTTKERALVTPLLNEPLLPSMIYFISNIDREAFIEPTIVAKWNQRDTFSQIAEHLLSFKKSIDPQELFKYISALVNYSQKALQLPPLACKHLLEEILHRCKTPSTLSEYEKKTIAYLAKKTAYTPDFRLVIQNKEQLDKLISGDVNTYLMNSPLLFVGSSFQRLLTFNLILKTRNKQLLSFVFRQYPENAYESLVNWMETFLNESDPAYSFLIEQKYIQKALLDRTDWPARFYEEKKSLALTLLGGLNESRSDEEVESLLSPSLLDMWLVMIQSHLQEMDKKLTHSLIRLFTKPQFINSRSEILLSSLTSLLLKASESSSLEKSLIAKILNIYLRDLQKARIQGSLPNVSEYIKFVKNVVDIHLEEDLIQVIWENETHEIFPEHFQLDSYIIWATRQPFCDAIAKELETKTKAAPKITQDQWSRLVLYFDNRIDLLKKLIALGEKHKITPSLIDPLYRRVILTQRALRFNLGTLKRLLERNYENELVIFQIEHVNKESSLLADETALLLECLQGIKRRESGIKEIFLDKLWELGFLIENPSLIFEAANILDAPPLIAPLYKRVIPFINLLDLNLQSLKCLLEKKYESDLILFQIGQLKTDSLEGASSELETCLTVPLAPLTSCERDLFISCFDRIDGFETCVKSAFFNKALEMGVFNQVPSLLSSVFKELELFDVSSAFCELLSLLIGQTRAGIFSVPELFLKIEEQVSRISDHYQEIWPASFKSLYCLYLSFFTKDIIASPKKHVEIVFNKNIQASDLLELLSKLNVHLASLPASFIMSYLNELIKRTKESSLKITDTKDINKLMHKIIQISDENESLTLLEALHSIKPENIELIVLYGKILNKALAKQNKAILRAISRHLNGFRSPDFQDKKRAIKTTFDGFIRALKPSDLLFALESTKLFQETLGLDLRSITFELIKILAKATTGPQTIEFIQESFKHLGDRSRKKELLEFYFKEYFALIPFEFFSNRALSKLM